MGPCASKSAGVHPTSPHKKRLRNVAEGHISSAAGMAGEALLGVAKELPWIAPVAFLIGAVVKAAYDAAALKEDAKGFIRVVRSVEGVLQQAAVDGKLNESAKEPVALVREALEEALAHCHKLARRGTAVAMLLSGRDGATFEELQTKLHRGCDLLALACAADTNLLVRASYDQAQRLEKEVEALGGAEAVAADPKLRERITSSLSAVDQVVVATLSNEISESQMALTSLLEAKFKVQEEERAARYDAMEQHLKTLTTMIQAVAQIRGDPTEQGGFEADKAYVAQLATPAIQRELAAKMPVPANEPARLLALDEQGLTGDALRARIADNADLRAVVAEAIALHAGDLAYIATVEKDRQTIISGEFRVNDGSAVMDGLAIPREMTQCQHVVATGAPRDVLWKASFQDDVIDMASPEAIAINKAGHGGFGQFHAAAGACMDESVPNGQRATADAPGTIGAVRKILEISGDEETRYRGVPISVCGENVCTLCTAGKGAADVKQLEALAAKAGKILEATMPSKAAPDPTADVRAWLTARRLGAFADGLLELGVECVEDMHDVEPDDCIALGMSHIQQNRLRKALASAA